ncbi:hypothetical protein PS922_05832 [Pseudomonas fluorescens]|uniref:Uncharacterized protein n=1 Tax=Pseudomonas fluorescens TaxID=294 RepID=A0A5E7V7T1_PSEFL|nr:hypothetical protein PS922_05832 [Pseudomonas fluorescens]
MLALASIPGSTCVRNRCRICVVATAWVPLAMARALACCCRSPAAWLTARLPWYCMPELSMSALLVTGDWAKVDALQNMAIISSVRFILTVSGQDIQSAHSALDV